MLVAFLMSLTFVLYGVCRTTSPCGPFSRCSCASVDEGLAVDCQKANLSYLETCDVCSLFNETVLSLDVSDNNLTGISNSCFSLCFSLRKLSLRSTNLNSAKACDICRQFNDTLISLDLSRNNISVLKDWCFTGCNRLEHLSLSDTNIHNLATYSLKNLKDLKELNLNHNYLIRNCRFTNPGVLRTLSNLQIFKIKENVEALVCDEKQSFLDNIPREAFSSLKELHLDGVEDVHFGQNFTYFKHLSRLNMSGVNSNCSIISLKNETFEWLPSLRYLDLSKCNITKIDAGSFEVLHELTYLNLSNNQGLGFVSLRNISYGLRATKINIFDFSKVYKTFGQGIVLRKCDIWFTKETSIEELYLNSNRIVMIETNALLLAPPNLTKIWAEDNKFSFGPFILQLGCLEKLQEIYLTNQNIVHDLHFYNDEIHLKDNQATDENNCLIPYQNNSSDACEMFAEDEKVRYDKFRLPRNLSVLALNNAGLKFKVEYAPVLPFKLPLKLESVDFSNNVLYYWGRQFVDLKRLRHLDLSNNFCSFIEVGFFDAVPYVETVKLSHNILASVLEHDSDGLIFKPLKATKTLDLSDNSITSLPEKVFDHLSSIAHLNLSNNQLIEFKSSSVHLKYVSQLDLHNNQLTTFPVSLLEEMKIDQNNISIDLSNNFLEVSCENLEFLSWLTENPTFFKNINSYIFRSNGESSKITFDRLKETLPIIKKQCVSYTALITVSSLLILTFFVVILGGMLYRYRWRLRYLYYMAKFRFHGYKNLPTTDPYTDYEFDAFLSCADEDMEFITREVLPKLENEFGYRCCVHARNFLAGVLVAENIICAIRRSRRTIIILTQSFLASKWCQYEFHMARMEEIYSRKDQAVLFVLMYEDIDINTLSLEMLDCIKSETYAKYPADQNEVPYFWEGVRQALRTSEM